MGGRIVWFYGPAALILEETICGLHGNEAGHKRFMHSMCDVGISLCWFSVRYVFRLVCLHIFSGGLSFDTYGERILMILGVLAL